MEIQTLNPTTPRQRQRIEAFLKRNGLRFDDMYYYAAITDDDGEMIAGGGLKGNVIKCVAVDVRIRAKLSPTHSSHTS